MADSYPPDFFTAPALKSLPAGVYAVVSRRIAGEDPLTLGTSYFCAGKDCCKWTESYADVMNIKIAIDPTEPEHRRAISRGYVKEQKAFVDDPKFVGPREVGCAPDGILLNVIHFKVVRGEGRIAVEHALVMGPCDMKDYGLALRALGLIGIHKDYVTMAMKAGDGDDGEE